MGFVDDLENSIDIVDLIGRYAKLKKTGANFKALCPFPGHSEKTPSFVVSPAKQIGYCFGCHKGGGPVKFIMDMENCEFREAVQMLGNITGREIQGFTENKEKIQIKKNLYSLYKDATSYYKQSLERHPEIKKYLSERGLNSEDITKFHFGYSDSGISLYNSLKDKGYDNDLIAASAIFLNMRTKKDKFIGRIIFPIQNLRGDFVAFAGRIIGQGEPKYLNSPASDIYDKSSILYGLYDARSTITKVDHIIITEGYMDAIALQRYGFFQTVAVSGTALTEKHITIIKRLTHKIYLCFDNDKAGTQATKSSLELLKNQGLEVKIIVIVGAKDPDEYLESGKDFQTLINTALSPIKYLIKKNNYNLESLDEKKKFLDEIMQIIKTYSDSIEQDMYLKELAQVSDTPVDVLYEIFRKTKVGKTPKNYDAIPE
ncbi:DNA primase, partial [Candidatus Gracilibacteria bacterium]|nr:DNA primase [Candidatus Gracilibacteria bacterium]